MERSVKAINAGFTLFVITLLTTFSFAQDTTEVDVNVDGNADSGILTGSPWLWLLFVAIFIIVIVVLTRGRKNS